MKRFYLGARLGVAAFYAFVAASCATGTAQDWDAWHDVPGDLPVEGIGDGIGDSSLDPFEDPPADTPLDGATDTTSDTSGDSVLDPFSDPLPDGIDVWDATDVPPDTAIDDVAGDEGSGTCTVADLVTQAMCGSGRKCTFTDLDAFNNPITFCDTAGGQGWNEICGSGGMSDNCEAGYICLGSGGGADTRCRRYCTSDFTCTSYPGGANAACEIGISVGGVDVVGVTTCSYNCNPLYQTGCDTVQACRASFPGDSTFWSDCDEAGTGSSCVADTGNDCPAGSDCFAIDGDGDTVSDYNECLHYCGYPSGTPICTGGTMCVQGLLWPSGIGVCI